MTVVIFLIVFFLAMIASNILNHLFPKIPLPVLQLLFGVFFGYFSSDNQLHLNPELFLALLIAPLLFREGEESDILSILKHWKAVLFTAFILVFLTVLSIGFSAHFLNPVIPFAACCAIGAALGPTDLVAMSSLSKMFRFPKWVANLLKGEGLINDASGIISFQFAISAFMYGTFSAPEAGLSVMVSSLGGIFVGGVLGWMNRRITRTLEELEAVDVTGHLLIEIVSPFVAFFLADSIHVSGIIAAVVAGVIQAPKFKKITLKEAEVDTIRETVWETLMFGMNAMVFTVFGIELQRAFLPMLEGNFWENVNLIATILLLTVVLFLTRYLALSIYYRIISWRRKKDYRDYSRQILLLTFAGVKGTVSIATILLTPEVFGTSSQPFPYRSTMLLIVAGVTLCSFFVGFLILPRLADKKESQKNHLAEIRVLEEVMNQLEVEAKQLRNRVGMDATIANYRRRTNELMMDLQTDEKKQELAKLRLLLIKVEMDGLEDAYRKKTVNAEAYRYYSTYLKRSEQQVSHHIISSFRFLELMLRRLFLGTLHLMNGLFSMRKRSRLHRFTREERNSLKELYEQNTRWILAYLENLKGVYDVKLINYLRAERIRSTETLHENSLIERMMMSAAVENTEEMMKGYYLERRVIFEHKTKGWLTNQEVLKLQRNVNLLESYSLKETDANFSVQWLKFFKRR